MSVRRYEGEEITVSFDARLCIHAARCVDGAPSVFDPKSSPWINPARDSPDHVASIVRDCPTGALRYESELVRSEVPDAINSVTLVENGPMYVRGELEFTLADGSRVQALRAALCRCGASEYKPFCDGSHQTSGFIAAGSSPASLTQPSDGSSVPLAIRQITNGPIHLSGAHLLPRTTTESSLIDETWLCRCGSSQNKPFCDGAHSRARKPRPATTL